MRSVIAFGILFVSSVLCGEYGAPAPEYGAPSYQPQTFKHVYIHSAPDEPTQIQSRTIRVPGGDKHVNIIFVKTPSQNSASETEVILPEQDEHKNLVYVLLKKGQNENIVNVRKPAGRAPQKPEVFFIRYKDGQQVSTSYGPGPAQTSVPSTQYGAY